MTILGLNRLCTDCIDRKLLNVSGFSGRSLVKIKPHLKSNLESVSVSIIYFLYEIRVPNL